MKLTALKVDPEFQGKIPPLTFEELEQLEKNIVNDGKVINPIIVWNRLIVDGHNRYAILQKHPDIPYTVHEKEFADRFEVIIWICKNQLGRRNLSPEQKNYLLGKQYEAEKVAHGGDRKSADAKSSYHNDMYNHYVRDGFGKLRISKIKYSDIKKFYYSLILEKGFKPNSMEIVHTLLHPTFTMAVRDGLLRLNPTEGVMAEIKKSHCWEKTKRHALTVAEQRAFTNYIANSEEYRGWFPLFTVMLGTGCRIGEVLGLRWQDVDFKNRTISINHNLVYRVQEDGTCTNHVNSPKTKAGIRIIPMIDEVFDAFLEEYQYQKVIGFCTDEIDGYSGFVFCTGDGKVYLPNAINRTIRSICADYNKEEESKAKEENRDPVLLPKFSCHILRHTFCTRFCENETNLKVIQEIMGHADISTTMDVYAEATQEKKKESMTSLQSALLVR